MWDRKVFVFESLIKEKARRLLVSVNQNLTEEQRISLCFSNGWLDRFKKRNGFKSFMSHGESADAYEFAISQELPFKCQKASEYALNDIFNADEFGLFYQAAPIRTIGPARLDGRKVRKERLTFLVCANADGTEKYPLMVIGRSKHPRCFGFLSPTQRGFGYHSNSKDWMNTELFFEWLHRFDCYIGKTANRKVLLLLNNAPCHGSIARLPELSNVSVKFSPKRTTSRLQTMDAGVIAALKMRYRSRLHDLALDLLEGDDTCKLHQADILRAVESMSDIWDKVDSTTIHNCWCSSNTLQISYQSSEENVQEENEVHNFAEEDDCVCIDEN